MISDSKVAQYCVYDLRKVAQFCVYDLSKVAQFCVCDQNGWTALHNAAYWANLAVVERLLQSGASINMVNKVLLQSLLALTVHTVWVHLDLGRAGVREFHRKLTMFWTAELALLTEHTPLTEHTLPTECTLLTKHTLPTKQHYQQNTHCQLNTHC